MGWLALLFYMAATSDHGPSRPPPPPPDPTTQMWVGIGMGVALAFVLRRFAWQAGQRLGDRLSAWVADRVWGATGQGGE